MVHPTQVAEVITISVGTVIVNLPSGAPVGTPSNKLMEIGALFM